MKSWTALLLAGLVAVACTGDGTDEVTPAPTEIATESQAAPLRIAVVLPPSSTAGDEKVAFLRDGVERIVGAVGLGVDVRIVQPDGPDFVADVATVLAADGYGLVCVLDAEAAESVVAVAAGLPGTRFCVDATRPVGAAANAWAPRPRYGEAAYLVGVATTLVAGDGVVGLIVREGEPALNSKRTAMVAGREAALAEIDPELDPLAPIVATLAAEDTAVGPVVQAVVSQEPAVVVVDAGPLTSEVVALVAEQAPSARLIQWGRDFGAQASPAPNAIVVVRDELSVFRLALTALLDGTFEELPETVGIAEGIHAIQPVGTGDPLPVLTRLNAWVEAILRGDIEVGEAAGG